MPPDPPPMPSPRSLPLLQAALVLLLGVGLGWGTAGWLVAVATTVTLDAAVVWLRRRTGGTAFGPADLVTLTRATLACGVLALVVEALLGGPARALTLASVAGVALVLDLVDGWLARRTRTESAFGARLDGEVDAFLMLVLSAWVASALGWWVLGIGIARYAFGLGGIAWPWLRARLPFRSWRKVVTGVASTVLVVAAAGVLPSPAVDGLLVLAVLLVAESFGRDVWWLWRRRRGALHRAREAAYGRGEFVDQQGFMTASEIRRLARRAGVRPGDRVLDLCCGRGGPGRLVARETGCSWVGVDADPDAVATARAHGPPGLQVIGARVPPLPEGRFDVILLLETMLAFRDKSTLMREVREGLVPGGTFACTVEEGTPLTEVERVAMPDSDTVWPVPLAELLELLERTGFEVIRHEDRSRAHRVVIDRLLVEITAAEEAVAAELGAGELDRMRTALRLWGQWLDSGRIRKYAVVAHRR